MRGHRHTPARPPSKRVQAGQAKARTRKSKPRPVKKPDRRSAATQTPSLVVVGTGPRQRAVKKALRKFNADLKCVGWDESVLDAAAPPTVGVLIAEFPPSGKPWKTVGTLRELLDRSIPLAVLAPDDTPATTVRRIYGAGANIVVEWPRESLLLGRLLAEMLGFELVRGPAKKASVALKRAVNAHLKYLTPRHNDIRVHVDDGVVALQGTVDRLYQREDLEAAVSRVPGVTGVLSRQVKVSSRSPDRSLERTIDDVLKSLRTKAQMTVSVRIQSGTVTLAGSIATKSELDRLVATISHIRGVRAIDNDVVPSNVQHQRDATVATRVKKLVETMVDDGEVGVTVFGRRAVLSGWVPHLPLRRELCKAVSHVQGVERVIDKLEVAHR